MLLMTTLVAGAAIDVAGWWTAKRFGFWPDLGMPLMVTRLTALPLIAMAWANDQLGGIELALIGTIFVPYVWVWLNRRRTRRE